MSTIATDCFSAKNGTSEKIRKSRRWAMRQGGPRCDACGADCGGWAELLAHLQKSGAVLPAHAGAKEALDAQRERVEEVVEEMRSPRRKAA